MPRRSVCERTAAMLGRDRQPVRRRPPLWLPEAQAVPWESLLGNRALQSLLAPASPGPKSCSCGGTCPSCSKDDEGHPASRPWRQWSGGVPREAVALLEVMSRPPDQEIDEPDETLLPHSRARGLLPWIEPGLGREFDRGPHAGAATIVCDGNGGYRTKLDGSWVDEGNWTKCGVRDCVELHEQSHARDWEKKFPDGCKNEDGSFKPDGTAVPTGGAGYDEFLPESECKAYKIELACEEKLLESAGDDCKADLNTIISDRKERVKELCRGGGC
jgi:hypothetical protein